MLKIILHISQVTNFTEINILEKLHPNETNSTLSVD